MYIGRYVNYPLFLSDFNETWIFSMDLRKTYQISWKSVKWLAEFFHADGRTARQTDMTKVIVAFHNYANAPIIQELGWRDSTKVVYKVLLVPWRSL